MRPLPTRISKFPTGGVAPQAKHRRAQKSVATTRYYLGFVLSHRMFSEARGAQGLPARLCLLTRLCVTKTFINNNYQFCWSSCILINHVNRDGIHRFVTHRTITSSVLLAPRPRLQRIYFTERHSQGRTGHRHRSEDTQGSRLADHLPQGEHKYRCAEVSGEGICRQACPLGSSADMEAS